MYYQDDFRPFYERRIEFMIDFNTQLTELILKLAGMDKKIKLTESYSRPSTGINDLRQLIDPQQTAQNRPYWQVFKQKYGFQPNLSAVDLLFNMGPEFPLYL